MHCKSKDIANLADTRKHVASLMSSACWWLHQRSVWLIRFQSRAGGFGHRFNKHWGRWVNIAKWELLMKSLPALFAQAEQLLSGRYSADTRDNDTHTHTHTLSASAGARP